MQLSKILSSAFISSLLSDTFLSSDFFSSPKVVNNVEKSTFIFDGAILRDDTDVGLKQQTSVKRRPLIIWHGLGDNYNSSGMNRISETFRQVYPDIRIYMIYLDQDPSRDQQKSLFGRANKELQEVCKHISLIPELNEGFDAIGLSQGGLFLRALAQTCTNASINNLITFGSPHMGVSELPLCKDPNDWICRKKNEILKRQVWNENVQNSIIPAQYFRDPYQYDNYLAHSHFLADINNERVDNFNSSYSKNLNRLKKFIMITFTEDTTLVPKYSAGFNDFDVQTGKFITFDKTMLYKDDLVGLKKLHEDDKLEFFDIDGDHMVIPDTFLVEVANKYIGGLI